MNRTLFLFGIAGVLALLALFVSPRIPTTTKPPPPPPTRSSGSGSLTMETRFSHPLLPPGASEAFVTVDIKGADLPGTTRRAVQLALVIDRSGSMQGEKLQNAKAAARQLISQLTSEDTLALIHYGSDVEVLPSRPMTAANREAVLAAVNRIEDAGGTNISGALAEAGQALREGNPSGLRRIILVSDGQPTEGETDPRLISNLSRNLRQAGVSVSAIGVGTDFNEDLMQAIAELGAGSYGYLRDTAQLASLFARDLQQASTRVARGVELAVELPAGVTLKDALGYRTIQDGQRVRIALSDFSARQEERVVLALNVQAPAAGSKMPVAAVSLAYEDLIANGPRGAQASLDAEVTEQLAAIADKRDKNVAVAAARAQTAANVMHAADALRVGRKDEAQSYLKANEPILRDAERIAGPAAVAGDLRAQNELSKQFEGAAAPAEIEHEVKAAKREALKGFGRMGSTY